jgi:hypothetical protein
MIPILSDRHKVDLLDLKYGWITHATKMERNNQKTLIKTLSYEKKGLGESYIRYPMRDTELLESTKLSKPECHPSAHNEAW